MPFEKGHGKIPGSGRKKGTTNKYSLASLQKELQKAAKKKDKKSAYQHVAEQFFEDNAVMINVLKMQLPTLKSIDMIALLTDVGADTEEAERIRQKLLERFGLNDKKDKNEER